MKRLRPLLIAILLTIFPVVAVWAGQPGAAQKLSLSEAVRIAVERNLTMADSRLAVGEKEYKRREAFSDFFPLAIAQYNGIVDRYGHPYPFYNIEMWGMTNNGIHDSRYAGYQQAVRMQKKYFPTYPYRIDPYRQITGAITITQPIFSGGKLINEYKYAKLGVDYSSIQYDVNRQDLILNVNQAYYRLLLSQKLLQVANESIKALEGLRDQTKKFYQVGLVPKVDLLSTKGS